jgi:hypothetical protein
MSLVPPPLPSLGSVQLDEEINSEVLLNPVRGFQSCATPIVEAELNMSGIRSNMSGLGWICSVWGPDMSDYQKLRAAEK